jgi:hypothetical protein
MPPFRTVAAIATKDGKPAFAPMFSNARSAAAPASSLVRCCPKKVYAIIRRRAAAAAIGTKLGNHSFRATGITQYLKKGTLEKAAALANHASTRTRSSIIVRATR